MTSSQRFTSFAGRILLSLIFIMSGVGKLADHAGTVGYISSVHAPMPEVAYWIAVVVEVGFGLALLVGYSARLAAFGLAVFTLAAAFLFHNNFADQIQMIMFLKNITIIGGLLLVVAHGAGGISIDNRKNRSMF
jgi:putative oxidoreductase